MIMKKASVFALAFLMSLATAAAEEFNKDFHRSFNVKKGDSLSLRFGDGDVKIIPWDKNILDVNVRYRADIDLVGIKLGGRKNFDVEFRQTADTVYVTGKEISYATIGYHRSRVYEYVYEIHSPDFVRLDLDGDDGDVEIENWAEEIKCRIDDGDIFLKNILGEKFSLRGEDSDVRIENLSGDLTVELDDGDVTLTACRMGLCRLESNDGNITIKESKGSFDIGVDDGDVVMDNVETPKINIRTEDGDIEIDHLAAGKADVDIKTVDGDVVLGLERGFSTAFHVSSSDAGNIRLDLDNIADYKEAGHFKSGSINGGNGRLSVRTDDGIVTINER